MLHGSATRDDTPDHASGYKARLGILLFILYALIYAVFVGIGVFDVTIMEKEIVLGLNLAVVFGFGLIVFALLLALFYNALCSAKEKLLNTPATRNGEGK